MTSEQTITDNLIHEFSKTIEMFGLSPADARLFTTLYLNHRPMTLDEMSQTTGKSKTSVNTGIRNLSDLNLVKQVWKKGVRKDLYAAEDDLFNRFMHTYLDKWIGHINLQKRSLDHLKKHVYKRPQGELIEEKLANMITFHSLIEKTFHCIKEETDHML
ncbi:GbsR/MarR family transcriptional regulator [Amphibacillus cookii]|uniref:GbsR/MarR family transcriptional regulator n=1 Tax=Amphibacillus cookii TaxID=767787 RepID=UPI00195BD616|nr:helix-turn-helix domain-containing protein [Amphibacillus cookii]MBM7541510.1 DNA-binding transcriptional regulator GbsR (MarR family) [Amphibacillus cookii]